jgi:hypothetical protein
MVHCILLVVAACCTNACNGECALSQRLRRAVVCVQGAPAAGDVLQQALLIVPCTPPSTLYASSQKLLLLLLLL